MEVDRHTLSIYYLDQGMTIKTIALHLGISKTSVGNLLKHYGIPTRKGREAQKTILIDKESLSSLYTLHHLSCEVIASQYSVSPETIRRLLLRYQISRRSKTEGFGGHNKGQQCNKKFRQHLSKKRKEMYASGQLIHWNTGRACPEEVRRKISQTLLHGRQPAENYYGFDWHIQRTSCLQRDSLTCQQCGTKRHLEVHHWEPYRFSFDNSLDNLVTLCSTCHRELHKQYVLEGFIAEAEETQDA